MRNVHGGRKASSAKAVIALLAGLMLTAGYGAEAGEPGRLLYEADFASDNALHVTANYNKALTLGVKKRGNSAIYIVQNKNTDKKFTDTLFLVQSELVPVSAGSEIAIVTEARGSVPMDAPSIHSGFATAVLWYGADQKPILSADVWGKMQPTGKGFGFRSGSMEKWLKSVKTMKVPVGAAYAKIQIGADNPNVPLDGGYLAIKRISVREREGANGAWNFGDFKAPTYRRVSASPDPNPNAVIRFKVMDESPLDMSKFVCKLDGVDVTDKVKGKKEEGKNETTFVIEPQKPWAKDSLHLVDVAAVDIHGNASHERLAFCCGELTKKGVATLRDDGMILIDGKPFFPISPTGVRKAKENGFDIVKTIAKLKAAGFNTVHSYDMYSNDGVPQARKNLLDLLDVCEREGIKVINEMPDRDYKNPTRPNRIQTALAALRKYTCVLGWGLGDDTVTNRPDPTEIRNDNNIIKAIDNAHLTWQFDIASYEGRQIPYAGATDIFICEVYPFRKEPPEPDGLASVARHIRNAYDDCAIAGNPPWSIWAGPQAFSGWNLWFHFPTTAEIRAQSYLAVIHGARGLNWYSYMSGSPDGNTFGRNEEQFSRMAAVSSEIATIQDDLASRDAKVQPKVTIFEGPHEAAHGIASVTCLMKDGAPGKGKLLLAANARQDKAVKVRFDVTGPVEVLFENGRKIEAKDGIVDTFEPGAVHVYRFEGARDIDIHKADRNMSLEKPKESDDTEWIDGKDIPMEGNAFWPGSGQQYWRLPPDAEGKVSRVVYGLSSHSTGLSFRFITDSPFIHLKWRTRGPFNPVDTYGWDEKRGEWRLEQCRVDLREENGWRENRFKWRPGMPCLIELPLLQVTEQVKVGIKKGTTIRPMPPRRNGITKPVVFYGTSITHGAHASRAGLSYVNQIGRRLDVPIVNLGFSGNGDMQLPMTEFLARIDASCYVIDVIHNCGACRLGDRGETMLREIHARHPDTPIILVEATDLFHDFGGRHRDMRILYEKFVAEGWKHIRYVKEADMFTEDTDANRDYSHPNDFGMLLMAYGIGDVIAEELRIPPMKRIKISAAHSPFVSE